MVSAVPPHRLAPHTRIPTHHPSGLSVLSVVDIFLIKNAGQLQIRTYFFDRATMVTFCCEDAGKKFVDDFAAAWNKVMNLDRFDSV